MSNTPPPALPPNKYRARVLRIYSNHAPDKLKNVERSLEKFAGREEKEMFPELERKYGPEPMNPRPLVLKYLMKNAPEKMKTIDTAIEKYVGREDALLDNVVGKYPPLPEETVASFQPDLQQAYQASIDRTQVDPETGLTKQQHKDTIHQLTIFFTFHDKAKVGSVPTIMDGFKQNYDAMWDSLFSKYGDYPTDEQIDIMGDEVLDALPVGAEEGAPTDKRDELDQPSIEATETQDQLPAPVQPVEVKQAKTSTPEPQPSPAAALTPTLHDKQPSDPSGLGAGKRATFKQKAKLRKRLNSFFEFYEVDKSQEDVEKIVTTYAGGREEELFQSLEQRHGPEPPDFDDDDDNEEDAEEEGDHGDPNTVTNIEATERNSSADSITAPVAHEGVNKSGGPLVSPSAVVAEVEEVDDVLAAVRESQKEDEDDDLAALLKHSQQETAHQAASQRQQLNSLDEGGDEDFAAVMAEAARERDKAEAEYLATQVQQRSDLEATESLQRHIIEGEEEDSTKVSVKQSQLIEKSRQNEMIELARRKRDEKERAEQARKAQIEEAKKRRWALEIDQSAARVPIEQQGTVALRLMCERMSIEMHELYQRHHNEEKPALQEQQGIMDSFLAVTETNATTSLEFQESSLRTKIRSTSTTLLKLMRIEMNAAGPLRERILMEEEHQYANFMQSFDNFLTKELAPMLQLAASAGAAGSRGGVSQHTRTGSAVSQSSVLSAVRPTSEEGHAGTSTAQRQSSHHSSASSMTPAPRVPLPKNNTATTEFDPFPPSPSGHSSAQYQYSVVSPENDSATSAAVNRFKAEEFTPRRRNFSIEKEDPEWTKFTSRVKDDIRQLGEEKSQRQQRLENMEQVSSMKERGEVSTPVVEAIGTVSRRGCKSCTLAHPSILLLDPHERGVPESSFQGSSSAGRGRIAGVSPSGRKVRPSSSSSPGRSKRRHRSGLSPGPVPKDQVFDTFLRQKEKVALYELRTERAKVLQGDIDIVSQGHTSSILDGSSPSLIGAASVETESNFSGGAVAARRPSSPDSSQIMSTNVVNPMRAALLSLLGESEMEEVAKNPSDLSLLSMDRNKSDPQYLKQKIQSHNKWAKYDEVIAAKLDAEEREKIVMAATKIQALFRGCRQRHWTFMALQHNIRAEEEQYSDGQAKEQRLRSMNPFHQVARCEERLKKQRQEEITVMHKEMKSQKQNARAEYARTYKLIPEQQAQQKTEAMAAEILSHKKAARLAKKRQEAEEVMQADYLESVKEEKWRQQHLVRAAERWNRENLLADSSRGATAFDGQNNFRNHHPLL